MLDLQAQSSAAQDSLCLDHTLLRLAAWRRYDPWAAPLSDVKSAEELEEEKAAELEKQVEEGRRAPGLGGGKSLPPRGQGSRGREPQKGGDEPPAGGDPLAADRPGMPPPPGGISPWA